MQKVKWFRDLVGHYIVVHCQTNDGNDFTVEGILRRVGEDFFELQAGNVRRIVTNVIILQVADYGEVGKDG